MGIPSLGGEIPDIAQLSWPKSVRSWRLIYTACLKESAGPGVGANGDVAGVEGLATCVAVGDCCGKVGGGAVAIGAGAVAVAVARRLLRRPLSWSLAKRSGRRRSASAMMRSV